MRNEEMGAGSCEHLSQINLKRLENSTILKDTCVSCYDSQDSHDGVNLCLDCLTVNCTGDLDHYNQHKEITGHRTFFNIRRYKVESEDENDGKPRVQIRENRLEVENNGREAKYKYEFKIGCNVCDYTSQNEQENSLYKELAKIIEKKPNEVEESRKFFLVGNELVECVHTKETSEEKSIIKALTPPFSCKECKLDTNLWLCLSCGNIGCGRKQYGVTDGNGHALLHYENEKHPLIVKLGTISEISSDVYCYVCDDVQIDLHIKDRLKKFHIDPKDLTKTEKSISELNLERNINFEIGSTDKYMRSVLLTPEETLIGISNFGNTCYLSSIIQLLLRVKPFVDDFSNVSIEHMLSCEDHRLDCLFCQLKRIVHGSTSGRYVNKKEVTSGLSPLYFLILCAKKHPTFQFNKQQDALEFLLMIINDVETIPNADVSNFLSSITHEVTLKKICSSCEKVSLIPQKGTVMNLSIPTRAPSEIKSCEVLEEEINKSVTFEECLRYTFAPYFHESNCPEEGRRVKFEFTQSISKLPKYFILSLNRYLTDNKGNIYKHNAKVKIPDTLNLKDCIFEPVPSEKLMVDNENTEGVPEEVMNPLLDMGFTDLSIVNAYLMCKKTTNISDLATFILSGEGGHIQKKPRPDNIIAPTQRPGGSTLYDLTAFVSHTGSKADSGHYIAHFYSPKIASWVTANDTRLLKLDHREEESENSYICLFVQRDLI